jgi:hypothetical protein
MLMLPEAVPCAHETALQTPDAGSDGVGGILRVVFGATAMMVQEFGDLFVFEEGFGLFWLGSVLRVEDGFQFSFFAVEAAHGFDIVQCKAALLEAGIAAEGYRFAGGRVCDVRQTELLSVELGNFCHKV